PVDVDLLRQIEQFLFLEARLADEGAYDGWEALWTDDGVYWIPANGDDIDPTSQMSILFDNRSRIALRVRQLKHDKRHAQNPRSRLRRLLVTVDHAGNSPRLRLEDLRTGRVGYLDALELETLAWLPDGALHGLLDPSHVRWRST